MDFAQSYYRRQEKTGNRTSEGRDHHKKEAGVIKYWRHIQMRKGDICILQKACEMNGNK